MNRLADTVAAAMLATALPADFRDTCVKLLDDVRTADSANWHPLGFAVLVWNIAPASQLRMHIWPTTPHEVLVVDHRHDHRWDLHSYILCGSLTEHELRLTDVLAGSDASYRVAQITQLAGVDTVHFTGRVVRIEQDIAKPQREGDLYAIPAGRFHWSEPGPNSPTVTIVRSDVVLERGPLTLIPDGEIPLPPVSRPEIPDREISDLIAQVRCALDVGYATAGA